MKYYMLYKISFPIENISKNRFYSKILAHSLILYSR